MNALVCDRPGQPDLLRVMDVPKPMVPADGVLVRVHASSVNVADMFTLSWLAHAVRGFRPVVVGRDFAGVVEATEGVTDFKTGDEVFGAAPKGAMAEYIGLPASAAVARKPDSASFEQAAAVPLAATTALQAVRDHGRVAPGQKVLVNGGSGAVGTFTVQIAKAFGGDVTAVCSTPKFDLVRSLGATTVIDYTTEDFTQRPDRYDVLIDIAGSRTWAEYRRILKPDARFVSVGARVPANLMSIRVGAIRASQKYVFFIARMRRDDLATLRDLVDTGKLSPVIDRQYDLAHAAEAFTYLKAGHASGKVVVTL